MKRKKMKNRRENPLSRTVEAISKSLHPIYVAISGASKQKKGKVFLLLNNHLDQINQERNHKKWQPMLKI